MEMIATNSLFIITYWLVAVPTILLFSFESSIFTLQLVIFPKALANNEVSGDSLFRDEMHFIKVEIRVQQFLEINNDSTSTFYFLCSKHSVYCGC